MCQCAMERNLDLRVTDTGKEQELSKAIPLITGAYNEFDVIYKNYLSDHGNMAYDSNFRSLLRKTVSTIRLGARENRLNENRPSPNGRSILI